MNSWSPFVASLSRDERSLLLAALGHHASEEPLEKKVFVGNESAGHCTHAAREIKKAKARS